MCPRSSANGCWVPTARLEAAVSEKPKRDDAGRWKRGCTGNPNGRPPKSATLSPKNLHELQRRVLALVRWLESRREA